MNNAECMATVFQYRSNVIAKTMSELGVAFEANAMRSHLQGAQQTGDGCHAEANDGVRKILWTFTLCFQFHPHPHA